MENFRKNYYDFMIENQSEGGTAFLSAGDFEKRVERMLRSRYLGTTYFYAYHKQEKSSQFHLFMKFREPVFFASILRDLACFLDIDPSHILYEVISHKDLVQIG